MLRYKVLKPVTINTGEVIELTWEQASPRLHNLKPGKKGKYEVKAPVRFKAGEVIGLANVSSKALYAFLEAVGG